MAEPVIATQGLTKRYGDTLAVDRLTLTVHQGEVFGLLGPNGAGKTTTILMLLGLTEPTSGTVRVLGRDPTREPLAVKRLVGYMPDAVGFYEDLTAEENLLYTAELNGVPRAEALRRIEARLAEVDLAHVRHAKVGTFSRGMRQRLGIADALIKDPRVLILDEPTTAIDPEGVRDMLRLIRSLARERGLTVLVSSHLLHQVQEICDRVGIFVKGRLVAEGPIEALAEQLFKDEPVRVEVRLAAGGDGEASGSAPDAAGSPAPAPRAVLARLPFVRRV
ncbi:MAG: ABC transporter ATP-binding protein, partial [Clostridia bacterium]|nr:ABC transporter ATP-binding protein [Clostridia bacterium]